MKTPELLPPPETMYRALVNRDASFEGIFFIGVRTTGIFCRPTCPAKKPARENVDFFASSSEALESGYRPCLRCHPMEPGKRPPELIERLSSPELSEQLRQEAMAKIAERMDLSFPLRSFAVVVARRGRIRDLSAIAETYRDMVDEMLGRERATLTFAIQPSDDEIKRVVAGLEAIAGKKIIPTVKIDSALIGGVTAELGGKIYDGSLASRLDEARRRLAG